MNMSNSDVSISTELERLESERLIGESLIITTRDRYASEIGREGEIEHMLKCASMKPKTYALPKRVKKRNGGSNFIRKIKKLFGI